MKLDSSAVDDYLAMYSQEKQQVLQQLRNVIRSTAPDAEEGIFWNMPGYRLNGPLVYFAAYKNHVGFYPGPDAVAAFSEKLKDYKTSKAAIQFSYDEPLPKDTIKEITLWRLQANILKKR
jgi:uncharacterized protein YdhG (YjbR/CyaY superfamily)